jgi:FkbM family methyltransferase
MLHLLPVREAVVLPWVDGLRLNLFFERDFSRSVFAMGCLEPNEMTFFRSLLKPGMVVLDAGANEGLYSILAARAVGPYGVVVAVEPSPREFRRICANLELNHLRNVRVVPKGLLDKPGSAVLHGADAMHSGHNTFGAFVYESVAGVHDVEVQVTTVDDLLADQGLDKLDVLKIDVEGAEAVLLRGATRTLQRNRPVIIMELQEPSLRAMGSSSTEVLELLEDHAYRVYGFSDRSGRPDPLELSGLDNIAAVPNERVADLAAAGLLDD